MEILQATVDSNFSGKMSVREFVDNLQRKIAGEKMIWNGMYETNLVFSAGKG